MMLPTTSFSRLFLITALLLSFKAEAYEALPSCQGQNISYLKANGIPVQIGELPLGIFLARSAKIFIETGSLHLQAEQDFIKGKSQVLCLSDASPDVFNFSLSVPALLDLNPEKSAGNSIWQFNLLVDGHQVGIWNQASRLQSQSFKLSDLSSTAQKEVIISQTSHDQFEIIVKWHSKTDTKAAVIEYDFSQP